MSKQIFCTTSMDVGPRAPSLFTMASLWVFEHRDNSKQNFYTTSVDLVVWPACHLLKKTSPRELFAFLGVCGAVMVLM